MLGFKLVKDFEKFHFDKMDQRRADKNVSYPLIHVIDSWYRPGLLGSGSEY